MRQTDLNLLERLFEAEIYGHLPFQSKSKQIQRLHEEGMVEPMTRRLGQDGFGAIEVSGWALTHAGRLTYCESCDPVEETEGLGVRYK